MALMWKQSAAYVVGQIHSLWKSVVSDEGYIVLDQFQLGQELHHVFGMPVMRRRMGEQTLIRLLPKVCDSSFMLFSS
jgi:hypothetical protein